MQNGIHFIAGLPRSGSTLLAALLRQNPRLHAAMTSPVGGLVTGLQRLMSQENEGAVFIDDAARERVIKACVAAYYADIQQAKVVFDTNRLWATKLPLVAKLYPSAKLVCCVRNPAWVLDSLERLTRRNSLEPSGIFKFDPGGTVYSRVEGLAGGAGMVGFAMNAMREAVFDEHRERLLLLRFETLTIRPKEALAAIYDFVGEPAFEHDFGAVEQDFEALEFDARIGAPGLHEVRRKVRPVARRTVLPPDLFARYETLGFWERSAELPKEVRVI